ncbi:MAG TPA: hypothetical protein VNQ55_05275 [Parapedobacter sp.]|nr:hypothetical protein [Parapedobacter sp.]
MTEGALGHNPGASARVLGIIPGFMIVPGSTGRGPANKKSYATVTLCYAAGAIPYIPVRLLIHSISMASCR